MRLPFAFDFTLFPAVALLPCCSALLWFSLATLSALRASRSRACWSIFGPLGGDVDLPRSFSTDSSTLRGALSWLDLGSFSSRLLGLER